MSHAAVILAGRGLCAADPRCPTSALIADDDDPTILRCARHAREHLELTAVAR